ncbi:MAG: choice-of-anchor tandem repeat GloVer-containing protein, partial [Limisphaerales bacterium]
STTGQEYRATLIQGRDGALYGTSILGGSGRDGTVFRVNPDGSGYTVLKNFGSATPTQGANPMPALLEASDGKLYGTACFSLNTRFYSGGSSNNGVVFSLDKDGNNFAVLKTFLDSVTDGANPLSPLLEGADGRLYGTTYGGGGTNNAGLVCAITKDGSQYQVLWRFIGINGDGAHPSGNLVLGANGALYGTTERGGASDQGTLFMLSTNGANYTVLASFGAGSGAHPRGGLTLGPDGALYGTTSHGGALSFGAVFRYGMPIEEIADLHLTNGVPALTCVGIPGTNYWVERTAVLGPQANWMPLLQTNAPAGGIFFMEDTVPPPNAALYRMKR